MSMWQDDGSACVKAEAGSPEFAVEGEVKGSPVNALYDQPLGQGSYFEVDALALGGSVFVGVTSKALFAKGWKCRGLFFGRNLSSGGALVREGFGEEVKQGDKIGVLTELTSSDVTVTFYHNGRCLGPAFVAQSGGQELFPVVHTSTSGDRFAIRFGEAPAQRTRQAPDGAGRHLAEGCWSLQQLATGPELGVVPLATKLGDAEEVIMKVDGTGAGEFRLCIKVANKLRLNAKTEADSSLAPFDAFKPGPVMSTEMCGPPGMMEVEGLIASGLEGVHKWLARPDSLLLTGATCEMSFVPKSDAPGAIPATEVSLL